MTMDYTGYSPKYKINRTLTEQEREDRLFQKRKTMVSKSEDVRDWDALIRLNSTFIEVVDKFYAWKGFSFAFVSVIGCGWLAMVTGMTLHGLFVKVHEVPDKVGELIAFLVAMWILSIALLTFLGWLGHFEAFTFTHWPVRLNRHNRMVYVFRRKSAGGMLALKWDDIYFCMGPGQPYAGRPSLVWDIRGHVLAPDKKTVLDTFSMGIHCSKDLLPTHWEYLRRYMEEGPQSIPMPRRYLPIAEKRESFLFAAKVAFSNFSYGYAFLLFGTPFALITLLGRLLCMPTNKVPVWPWEVEEACRIEPGDPYEQRVSGE
ncbi:DUF6708 domain-containing protein [Cupriavidus sp. YAF13]|uniref:DUF6708 domain-containing protein n=1 Tax=Cupriavidus sp. YAF13 TaxID=3233075 RepID=UPI003F8F3444